MITSLLRKTNFTTKLRDSLKILNKKDVLEINQALEKMEGNYTIANDYTSVNDRDFLRNIGFLWNDFNARTKNNNFVTWGRSWLFGKNLSNLLLSWGESSSSSLKSIFRGHQHHDYMFTKIVEGHGLFKLWNGTVNTLFSSPAASMKINEPNAIPFNYDSFIIVQTAQKYNDWTITHWFRECAISWQKKLGGEWKYTIETIEK